VPFRSQDVELWRQFTQDVQAAHEPRLSSVIRQRFNVAQLDVADALKYWPTSATEKYTRWLLRVGVCTLYPDSYLAKCLSSLQELDTAALALALLSGPALDNHERTLERFWRPGHRAAGASTANS
jgi:hypothetical protein